MNKTVGVLISVLATTTSSAGPIEMNGGQEIHSVHRYQFDGSHKLVNTTDTFHCGAVPARAFK